MRRVCLLLLLIMVAVPAAASDDSLKKGMGLFQKHRYQDAWLKVYPLLETAGPQQKPQIHLSLGMICYESARLYRDLYRFALVANRDYLQRLLADERQSESVLARWYLAKTLMQTGALKQSEALIEAFLSRQHGNSPDAQLARVDLGRIQFRQGKTERAKKLWAALNRAEPATAAALAAAYTDFGLGADKPAVMCRDAIASLASEGRQPPIRVLTNTIGVYARQGLIDESRSLLQQADLKACFQEETLIENKVIRFYEPQLLLNLARYYAEAALAHFQAVAGASNPKLNQWAAVCLLDTRLLLGQTGPAKSTVTPPATPATLSGKLKTRHAVRQAVLENQHGSKSASRNQLENLLSRHSDPDTIADLLLTCVEHGIDFPEAVVKAATLAQKSDNSRRVAALNLALGMHYLQQNNTVKALTYLEAGRDKSNKNRIEYNDPQLLVALARGYYNQRYYSEALEIFFEMSKQFEAVRQLQVSIQGIYSMEQKSAGDAKLF